MKLVFVNRFFYPDISATSQMLTDAAFFLADRGHDVHVVTSRLRYEGDGGVLPKLEKRQGVVIHRIWTTGFGRNNLFGRSLDYLTFYISVMVTLLRMLEGGDRVIAKTDPPLISVPVSWCASIKGARLINWLQDLFPEVAVGLGVRIPGVFVDLLRFLRNRSLQSAQMNVVIGDKMRTRLLWENIATENIVVVHNWADGAAIKPGGSTGLREEWQLVDKFVVAYSGNLGRAHEIDTVLKAMMAFQDDPDIQFLFIGGGALMDALRREVQGNDLKNCTFKDYQPRERLGETLTLPDAHLIMLQPMMEGLIVPSKLYGILAAGKPSIFIGDPEGEVATILSEANAGVCIKTGDVEGLTRSIQSLRKDGVRKSMESSARQVFDQRYDSQVALKRLEEVLCQEH